MKKIYLMRPKSQSVWAKIVKTNRKTSPSRLRITVTWKSTNLPLSNRHNSKNKFKVVIKASPCRVKNHPLMREVKTIIVNTYRCASLWQFNRMMRLEIENHRYLMPISKKTLSKTTPKPSKTTLKKTSNQNRRINRLQTIKNQKVFPKVNLKEFNLAKSELFILSIKSHQLTIKNKPTKSTRKVK